jgi:hypothetical protein
VGSAHNGAGGFRKSIEAAERRRLAAEMRSKGASWQKIADEYYRGNAGNAFQAVKQFWAELPVETVEEIRSAMLAKLDGLETEVRAVMARRHYVISEGHVVRHHTEDCDRDGRCRCPVIEDDEPIYRGVDRVRQLVETQLKLIPGLAAPSKVEQATTGTVEYKITTVSPDELEQL